MTKTPDPAPPRLMRFRVDHPQLLGIGPRLAGMAVVTVDQPPIELEGWTLQFRGAAFALVSPRGWRHGQVPAKDGPTTTIGPLPLKDITCMWESDDGNALDRISRLDVGPLKRTQQPVDVAVGIDPKELGDA